MLNFSLGLLLALGLAPWGASAFLVDSEYFVATEPEHLLLNSVDRWDSEAASDFLTYQRPLAWDGLWYRQKKVFDLSLGSVSSRQFLTQRRLKVEAPLTDRLDVRVQYLEARDFEQDRRSFPLELRYRLTPRFALSAIGEPSLYKAEDDVGAALTFWAAKDTELKFTALWGDFQRNQRSLTTDEWSEAPRAVTLTATRLPSDSPQSFSRFELHHEPYSERSNAGQPTKGLNFDLISIAQYKDTGDARGWSYRVQADRARLEDFTASEIRTRHRLLLQGEKHVPLGRWTLRPGLNYFYRENRINSGRQYVREILPTVWLDAAERSIGAGQLQMSYGYECTVFDRESDIYADQNKIENRFNVKADIKFSRSGQLALLFTFDLDQLGSGETWEGGAGQFRLDF